MSQLGNVVVFPVALCQHSSKHSSTACWAADAPRQRLELLVLPLQAGAKRENYTRHLGHFVNVFSQCSLHQLTSIDITWHQLTSIDINWHSLTVDLGIFSFSLLDFEILFPVEISVCFLWKSVWCSMKSGMAAVSTAFVCHGLTTKYAAE